MKTLTLTELRRAPAKAKKLTSAGHGIRITEHGKPLWVLQPVPATGSGDDDDDEAFWRELLEAPKSNLPSAARLLIATRR